MWAKIWYEKVYLYKILKLLHFTLKENKGGLMVKHLM